MTNSRAVVFRDAGSPLELQPIPLPALDDGETLVRVAGCTLCGSDLHTYEGRRTTPTPTILGHEIVGVVEDVGAGGARDLAGGPVRVGDRVTWSIVADCGECFFCRSDLPQKCEHGVKYGHQAFAAGRELLGGLAEHCLLPATAKIVKLPEQLSLAEACPASCATATAAAALDAAGDMKGRSVCVMGLGLLGLTAGAMASAAGATRIIGLDLDAGRITHSNHFGFTDGLEPAGLGHVAINVNAGRGLDVVIEMSGDSDAIREAIRHVRIGGCVVCVGSVFPGKAVSIAPDVLVRRNLKLVGVHNYRPADLARAVQFLGENHRRFPFDSAVQQWFDLEHAEEAFRTAAESKPLRVGVKPSSSN